MKEKLSTDPYKGVRDFYPEDARIQQFLFQTMHTILASYGYEEYNASPLEPAELYEGKTSDEIVRDQTYTFTDRGDRRVTLRPEMTPTVARMVAGRRRELAFPLRWYSIPNVFRYERPQRGRLREHYQLNIDLFGIDNIDADVEIVSIAYQLLRSFGATHNDFEIRINSRELMNAAFQEAGFTPDTTKAYLRLIDKKDKISDTEFQQEKNTLIGDGKDPMELLTQAATDSTIGQAQRRLDDIIRTLHAAGITNVRYDSSVARGFDYYTGMVFEVFDLHPDNRRSVFGGGRYDNLASLFSDERIPATGCAVGDVTLRDFLETHDLLPVFNSLTDLYIGIVSDEARVYAQELAHTLRQNGVRVAVHLGEKKIGDQIKIADKKRIPYFTAIGTDEAQSKHVKIKNLGSGDEISLPEHELSAFLVGARIA